MQRSPHDVHRKRASARRSLVAALAALVALGAGSAAGEALPPAVNYSAMKWSDLTPGDWQPQPIYAKFDLGSLWRLDEKDPHLAAVMRKLGAELDKAPADRELDGRPVQLHGFVVLLKGTPDAMREFLLVPWQMTCAHTPPAAANQRIRVIANTPIAHTDPNQAIYVWGKLVVRESRTSAGKADYQLTLDRTEPYDWQRARRADW